MLQKVKSVIRVHGTRFLKAAFVVSAALLIFSYLGHNAGLYKVLRSVSLEAWIGLVLTLATTAWGAFTSASKEVIERSQERQQRNTELIERRHDETVQLIRELEDAIDSLNIRLSAIDSLSSRIEQNVQKLHNLEVQFADLDQRQKGSDRFVSTVSLIAKLIEDVAQLKLLSQLSHENTEFNSADIDNAPGDGGLGRR